MTALEPHASVAATSLTLLDRARQADAAAWHRLVDLYGPLVHHWCRRAGLGGTDAADVGQEVFTRVWHALDRFHRDRPGDSFRGWLRTITRRTALDHLRHGRRHPAPAGATDLGPAALAADEDPDAAELDVERAFLHRRALALVESDFEPVTARAFRAVVIDGLPAREVAAALGITTNAVYIAKSRVLARLRAELSAG
ncbi:MAG: RNA polymerase sigma factor [Pirellulales bacterium]